MCIKLRSEKVRRSILSVLNWQREDKKRLGEAFGAFCIGRERVREWIRNI